jgi:hypothetical protein
MATLLPRCQREHRGPRHALRVLSAWHAVVESKSPALLDELLADEVVFRSPAVFAPQEGKALTASYLTAALTVLGPSLRYVSQWHDQASAVLEFEADLDGVYVHPGRGHLAQGQ